MPGVKSLLKAAANDIEQTAKTQVKPVEHLPNSSTAAKPKNKKAGGRPTNMERGIESRKQYTLTLKRETYELIFRKAQEEGISFAKYMERAALEYISFHTSDADE